MILNRITMCEVVRSTFEDAFPYIAKDIEEAAFIGIDTEFTGLVLSEKQKPSLFDDGEARYQKLKASVSQFTLSQIGLSCFREEPDGNIYVASTYNIPLLPPHFGPLDVTFAWQVSSISFLCQHKFDFNKVAYEGVTFLNETQEKFLQQQIDNKVLFSGMDRNVDEHKLQHCCSLVANWLTNAAEGDTFQLTHHDYESVPVFVVVEETRQRFDSVWASQFDSQTVSLECVSLEKKSQLDQEATKEEGERIMKEQLGFTRVFNELVRWKKPLVGHNCLTDMLLMYEKFHKPLPSSFSQFKKCLEKLFPILYDTKHLCSILRPAFRDNGFFDKTGLSTLYQTLESDEVKFYYLYSPSVRHAENFTRYVGVHMPHEAGYDAYMAGTVFLRMAHLLTMHGLKASKARPLKFREYESTVQPYKNRVNIIRASINNVCLDGPDPASERPEMLVVRTRGNKTLQMGKLARLLSAYGSVDIQMRGNRQALVAAGNFRCSKDILKAFHKHKELHVTKYRMWKHSPVVARLLWSGILVSGSVCLWALVASFAGTKPTMAK